MITAVEKDEQRREALKLANTVRTERSKLKRELKAGRITIHELLEDPPSCIATMQIMDLLLVLPRFGRNRVNRVLTASRVIPTKEIGTLTQRQVGELMWGIRRAEPKSA